MSVQDQKVVHADIKPENPPERAAHYVDVPKMPWEATKFPGIKIKVLYTDETLFNSIRVPWCHCTNTRHWNRRT